MTAIMSAAFIATAFAAECEVGAEPAQPESKPSEPSSGTVDAAPKNDSATPSKMGGAPAAGAGAADNKKTPLKSQPYTPREPRKEVSLGIAVTLTYLPGFGAGHFYIGENTRGITYLVVETAVWGIGISSFITQAMSVLPTYTKVALIAFPLVWAALKAVETVDIVDAVEVANNRMLKPVGMLEYDSSTAMTTIARF